MISKLDMYPSCIIQYICSFLFPRNIVYLKQVNKKLARLVISKIQIWDETLLSRNDLPKRLGIQETENIFVHTRPFMVSVLTQICTLDINNNLIKIPIGSYPYILHIQDLECLCENCNCFRNVITFGPTIRIHTHYGIVLHTDNFRIIYHRKHYWLRYYNSQFIIPIIRTSQKFVKEVNL